jgi:hypothetical protein
MESHSPMPLEFQTAYNEINFKALAKLILLIILPSLPIKDEFGSNKEQEGLELDDVSILLFCNFFFSNPPLCISNYKTEWYYYFKVDSIGFKTDLTTIRWNPRLDIFFIIVLSDFQDL